MYFIAKTPLGQFKSVYYNDEKDISVIKKTLIESLGSLTEFWFDCDDGESGVVRISLGSDVIKNSAFIIVE